MYMQVRNNHSYPEYISLIAALAARSSYLHLIGQLTDFLSAYYRSFLVLFYPGLVRFIVFLQCKWCLNGYNVSRIWKQTDDKNL